MVVMSLYPNDERVRREAAALERAGIAVDVLCQRGEGQSEVEPLGQVTAYRVMTQATKENIGQYLWVSTRFALAAFAKLRQLARQHRYSVLQAHNMPDFLVFVGLLEKMLGVPTVLDLHDLSVELYKSKWNGRKSKLLLPMVQAIERISCGFASRLITTSSGFKERLVARGIAPDKITLVLNTADPHHFQFQSDRSFYPITRGLSLLYHGTVAERFGLTNAIRAVSLLQERLPETTLRIHGKYDPSYRQRLERMIGQLKLEGKVQLHGWCHSHQLAEIIRGADIGLAPYLEDEFMSLALSTKTFEYAATGLPIVATRLDSTAAIFSEDAIQFCAPNSAEDLADKIYTLSLDPQRRQAQTRRAQAILEQISGTVMEQRYLTMMKGLMGINGHNGNGNGKG